MSLEDYPEINETRKKEILGWSDAELIIEIEKGSRSRLPHSIPYMKAVLASRREKADTEEKRKALEINEALLQEARLANENSRRANRIARWAIGI